MTKSQWAMDKPNCLHWSLVLGHWPFWLLCLLGKFHLNSRDELVADLERARDELRKLAVRNARPHLHRAKLDAILDPDVTPIAATTQAVALLRGPAHIERLIGGIFGLFPFEKRLVGLANLLRSRKKPQS